MSSSNLNFPLSDKWEFTYVCVPTPPDPNIVGYEILSDNGIHIAFNNTNNPWKFECPSTFSFYGTNLRYPNGTKDVLYVKKLSELRLKATISIGPYSSACDNIEYGCPNTNPMSWTCAVIGIPMYDESTARNLWLEISPYWTTFARMSELPNVLFHGESFIEELWRITKGMITPGSAPFTYDLDILSIINSLSWGVERNINWDYVHIGDGLYFGIEAWGQTLVDFYIDYIDLTYTPICTIPTCSLTIN